MYAESALSDVAAAKTIIRCCDEIDDRYNRLAHDQAIAEQAIPRRGAERGEVLEPDREGGLSLGDDAGEQ